MQIEVFEYKTNNFICRLPVKQDSRQYLKVELPEDKDKFTVKMSVPLVNVHGYWHPELFTPKLKLDWSFGFCSAINKNFPFITFFDQNGINQFAVGIDQIIDETFFSVDMNQGAGTYDLIINMYSCPQNRNIRFLFDSRKLLWTNILADYRDDNKSGLNPQYPSCVWQPTYCTWYARHRNLNSEWAEQAAQTASDLGFGTFILDDGWSMESASTLSPEVVADWYSPVGDWEVCARKFSDFKLHVKTVKSKGLKYMLWVAPFLVGQQSSSYKKYQNYCMGQPADDGTLALNPRYTEITFQIADVLLSLVRKYDLDGLKIDFIDFIKNTVEDHSAREIKLFFERLCRGMEGKMLEFRQKYANQAMLAFATQFRANDVPFEFIGNLQRVAHLRCVLGDGVPVHSDPAYWNYNEHPENIARHMIAAITGVPMISVDFAKISSDGYEIIKNWIKFYKEHLEVFKNGRWQVNYGLENVKSLICRWKETNVIFIVESSGVDDLKDGFNGKVKIINLTSNPLKISCHENFDFHCNKAEKTDVILPAGYGIRN